MSGKPDAYIAYATDEGYLLPTLLSATQARANVEASVADVAVCFIGESSAATEAARRVCDQNHIEFRQAPKDLIRNLPTMYARLFLDHILEPSRERILYIDGDTQIAGSLDELAETRIGRGRVLAVRDPMTFTIDSDSHHWRDRKQYFESIGLPSRQISRYFNSGVMGFNFQDLPDIRTQCLSLLEQQKRPLRFPDQDVLNLALSGRNIDISYKWNFPSYFLNHRGIETAVAPKIYHFMSNPRPWQGPFLPWGKHFFTPYAKFLAMHPDLAHLRKTLPPWRMLKYRLQQYYKLAEENYHWRGNEFRRHVMQVEREAIV